jgi:adenylate cyclase
MDENSTRRLINAIILVLLSAFFIVINPLQMFEHQIQDATFQRGGIPNPNIVIIGVDDRALEAFGSFQRWDRSLFAEAVNLLNSFPESRPAVIGLDFTLTEQPDTESDEMFIEALRNNDNVVVGTSIRSEIIDDDGMVRSVFLRLPYEDGTLLSFPAAVALLYAETMELSLTAAVLENNGTYLEYTSSPGGYTFLSFSDIFEPDFIPIWNYGAIVLIGAYTPTLMSHYTVPLSYGEFMHSVEIQANAVQAILDGRTAQYAPGWLNVGIIIALIGLGLVVSEYVSMKSLKRALLILMAATSFGFGYYLIAVAVFDAGLIIPVLSPLVAFGMVFVYQLINGYISQSVMKNRVQATFKKYADPKLVDTLIETKAAESAEPGQRKHIAVLFLDVRDFTPLAERLQNTPETVVQILNEYLDLTSKAVYSNGGSIDKFMGDAAMVVFNGFTPLEDYVYMAVKTAWDIVQGSAAISASIKEHYGVDTGFGIGVHCGAAIIGNIGSSLRKDYTAIGDTVNIASRLESRAEPFQVLVSRDVADVLGDRIDAESIGSINLKGKSEAVEVFSLKSV